MEGKRLIRAVGIVTLIGVIAKVLGFARELVIAAYYGTSAVAEVYFVASIIPAILFNAISLSISSAMVPIYAEERLKSEKEATKFVSVMATFFLLMSILVTAVCMIFSPLLVTGIVQGFSPEQKHMTLIMTNIMLPSFIFFVLSAIATGVLNTNKKFTISALTPVPQSLVIMLAIILFSDIYGIWAAVIGTLLGAISQFMIQYPQFRTYKITFSLDYKPYKKKITDMLIMISPLLVASIGVQLITVTDRIFSSSLEQGSISALNYANKLMFLPFSIVTLSILTVLYPSIVDVAIHQKEKYVQKVLQGGQTILFATLPFVIIMLLQGEHIVQIAFERGAFTHADTIKTAQVLLYYTLGLVFLSLRDYMMKCYLAAKKTKLIMMICLIGVAINIALSFILSKSMGAEGIALSYGISMFFQTVWFFCMLVKGQHVARRQWIHSIKTILTAAFVFLLVSGTLHTLNITSGWLALMITVVLTGVSYLGIAKILKCIPTLKKAS